MPNLRLAFTHTPVGGKTRKELDAYIAGDDPITKRPFMPEIAAYLTQPLTEEEKKTGIVQRQKKRLIGPDTADNIQKYFDDRFWTDQLPIVMPTEERVAAMLKATHHKSDEIILPLWGGHQCCQRCAGGLAQQAKNLLRLGAPRPCGPAKPWSLGSHS